MWTTENATCEKFGWTPRQLKHIRYTQMSQGVHFCKLNAKTIMYNLEEIEEWIGQQASDQQEETA